MRALRDFYDALTLKPQGLIVVIAAFLPIIAIVAMGPAVPAMIGHFADDPEARAKVPAMIGAPGLAMAFLAPFAGLLVDRFGRKPLLLICTALYGVFGSAPLFLNDLDHIYYSRLLLGVSEAGILTVVNTLIGDYWDDKGRKNWLFLQGLLGPFLAGFIALIVGYATTLQWNGVFFVYLIAFPIWAAMFIWLFEPGKSEATENKPAALQEKSPFPWWNIIQIASVTLFCSMLYYVFIINGALVFREVGIVDPKNYAAIIFIPQFFILAGSALFKLLSNSSHRLQLGTTLLLMGVGLAGMGIAKTTTMMALALVVQQIAAGMMVPTLISWAQTKFDFHHRGTGMGVWTAAFFLGQSQSPRLVHLLDANIGSMQGAFLSAGLVGLSAAVIILVAGLFLRPRLASA
jgi:MFS family permease